MKKRNRNTKYSLGSLLLLLAFLFYYACVDKGEQPAPAVEKPVKAKKPKAKHEVRALKVFTGKVIGIKDGDTFEVLYDGQPERVRLAEIDCPEKSQPFGKNARQYASDLCFGKTVTVTSDGKRDRYGRVVGIVTTENGTNVNEQLIKAGLAWHYKDYSDSRELALLEQHARTERVGLWADKNPVAPWEWRKNKRKKKQ
ncbi:thermonuclease family protein [Flavobacterium cyanobacteriorum]|uniref:thermonuclease family protein n=1 Tax=Flavobacterium cyanobacteriorum TaxID=2022802 RepID=UPI0013FD5F01|nr:thermonuclease family protein [Flavobacterium cyanobacteriorum]